MMLLTIVSLFIIFIVRGSKKVGRCLSAYANNVLTNELFDRPVRRENFKFRVVLHQDFLKCVEE